MKALRSSFFSAAFNASGWFAATAQNEAPKRVSGLVVKTSSFSFSPGTSKNIWAPSERPIQLCCIRRTRSGQRSSFSIAFKRSSPYSVIFKNHCDRSFFSTVAPDLQPLPSITCSFASTVFSMGSQLTQLSFRYAKPFLTKSRNIFCSCW